LLSRLRNCEDQESWREFVAVYGQLIFSIAVKPGLTEEEAEDVVQETVISVAKTMPGFRYDPSVCSFKSWLWRLTRARIADELRKRGGKRIRLEEVGCRAQAEPAVEEIADPAGVPQEAVWEEEFERTLTEAAVSRVKQRVRADHFQVFDFYALREMPVTEVARLLHVSVPQVYLRTHRIRKMMRAEARQLREKGI
jgi:RNA polymerase sigma-70 factor (ECF subfamily)